MKIIQSFWSKPLTGHMSSRHNYGWPEKKYFYMSQALSCLQLRKYYSGVELVTDTAGKRILIDELELPYTRTHVELDAINHFQSGLWSIKNLYTYNLQKKPFIHVDGDVYISGKFSSPIEKSGLISGIKLNLQSLFFQNLLNYISSNIHHNLYPPSMPGNELSRIYHTGIFGGKDISFITAFTKNILKCIDDNSSFLNNIYFITDDFNQDEIHFLELLNTIIEPYLFTAFATKSIKEVKSVLKDADFSTANGTRRTIKTAHLDHIYPVYNNKRKFSVCNELEHTLRWHYPCYYYKINSLLKGFRI